MIRTKKYLAILQITREYCRINYRNGIGISEILQEDIAGRQIQRARSKKLKKKRKKLEIGNELRSVMDDPVRTFAVKNTEDGFYRHADMDVFGLTDEVRGDPCSFFEFDDRKNIGFQR